MACQIPLHHHQMSTTGIAYTCACHLYHVDVEISSGYSICLAVINLQIWVHHYCLLLPHYLQSWAFKKHTVKRKRKFRNQNFSSVKRKRKFRNQKFLSSKRKLRNHNFLRLKRKRKFRNQNFFGLKRKLKFRNQKF